LKAAIAAANVVLVSPCTTTQSGRSSSSTPSIAAIVADTMWFSVWLGRMMPKSRSIRKPKNFATGATMCACWPVEHVTTSNWPESRSAMMSGASLMASGRVPSTIITFFN